MSRKTKYCTREWLYLEAVFSCFHLLEKILMYLLHSIHNFPHTVNKNSRSVWSRAAVAYCKTYFKNPFTIWSSASFSVRPRVIRLISGSPENWKLPGRASLFCYNQTLNTIFVPDICIPFLLYVYGADSAPVLECRKDPTDSYLQTRA